MKKGNRFYKIISTIFILLILLSLTSCVTENNKELVPEIICENENSFRMNDIDISNEDEIINTLSRLQYGFNYSNIANAKITIELEAFVDGIKIEAIESEVSGDNTQEGKFGLAINRKIYSDKKVDFVWALEVKDKITILSSDKFDVLSNSYSLWVESQVYPKAGIDFPVITFCSEPKNEVEENTFDISSEEYYKHFLTNYKYVFFLKFKFI